MPAVQSSTLDYVMELLAQLRPAGRVLINFRIPLDGVSVMNKELDLGQRIPDSTFKGHKLAFQYTGRGIFSSGAT